LRRGEVFDARLDPTQGSEQAGTRPVVIVSRNAINEASPVVVVVPFTTYREGRRVYPSQVLVEPPDGGLGTKSLALGEQVRAISKSRLSTRRGALSMPVIRRIDEALLVTLDLPGQETG
jgi:mRNA interferase MazF